MTPYRRYWTTPARHDPTVLHTTWLEVRPDSAPAWSCTCPGHRYRHQCRHTARCTRLFRAGLNGGTIEMPFPLTQEVSDAP